MASSSSSTGNTSAAAETRQPETVTFFDLGDRMDDCLACHPGYPDDPDCACGEFIFRATCGHVCKRGPFPCGGATDKDGETLFCHEPPMEVEVDCFSIKGERCFEEGCPNRRKAEGDGDDPKTASA